MKHMILVVVLVLAAGPSWSASVTLQCKTSDGRNAADLLIDLDNKMMRWGTTDYDIVHTDDKYITAYERNSGQVGGEVWVIERQTGEYMRGGVAELFGEKEKPKDKKLQTMTYSGRCLKKLF